MPDEELEGLSEEESALMAEYESEGELPPGEAAGEAEQPLEAEAAAPEIEPEVQPEAIKVPLHELKEERQKRQRAEQDLSTLMERTNVLLSQIQQVTAPAPEQPPDRFEDPVGYLQWQNDQLLQRLEAQQQRGQEYMQTQAQEQEALRFWNDYNQTINDYATKVPDFKAAADFLAQSRRSELAAMGVTDPGQQDQIMWQDSFAIAAQAKQTGQNHAEIFYNLAKQRGYQGAAPPPPVKQQPKSLDTVKRGQEAAQSLTNVGGTGGDYELTAEALISMSEEEFTAATSGKKWRKLHGS